MNMDLTQIKLFEGIDLNDSFVLNWKCEGDRLSFDLDASIWPESEHYTKPNEGEYTCYRKATLEFIGANKISGLISIESAPSTIEADGSKDYGNIDSLQKSGDSFELTGGFGTVHILGGELRFEVHT